MIKLMLDKVLRISEVIELKWRNIDLMSGKIKAVEGKGAKDISPHNLRHTCASDFLRVCTF